jgi:hypothetical protein
MTDVRQPVTTSQESRQFDQQLADVESRLRDQYAKRGGADEGQVKLALGRVAARFTNARVRNFLPILIERGVRRELDL